MDSEKRFSVESRVSARQYRPQGLSEVIGQEVLVQTLRNAILKNRLPHAFVFTGVRGVGKTTTARILARGLNCTGVDGQGGPTPDPCGQCPSCRTISQERHMDIIEMDAASHTGVDDVRELIEAARYRPSQARYKVYIIDEAHMLSKSAFNALLKTLETPPGYVKFIFATTEIRKIPQTVLSRCMRFDLCRISLPLLKAHFQKILKAEGFQMEEGALALIAQSADGSVRDGLSLLDQAVSLGEGMITEGQVRSMLGLSHQGSLPLLYDSLLQGQSGQALQKAQEMYQQGSEPLALLEELMTLTHQLTLYKAAGGGKDSFPDNLLPLGGFSWVQERASALSMAVLTRFWQILLKGYEEVQKAPLTREALEMILIRLAYVQELPTLSESEDVPAGGKPAKPSVSVAAASLGVSSGAGAIQVPFPLQDLEKTESFSLPQSLEDMVRLMEIHREPLLRFHLGTHVRLIRLLGTHLEIQVDPGLPSSFISDLKKFLGEVTKQPWQITLHDSGGQSTLQEKSEEEKEMLIHAYQKDPWVQEVLTTFPGSVIQSIHINKESE